MSDLVQPRCGGCRDLGAHAAWCPERVGPVAAKYVKMAAMAESIGDDIGGNEPQWSSTAWGLASWLRLRAREEEAAWLKTKVRPDAPTPQDTGPQPEQRDRLTAQDN